MSGKLHKQLRKMADDTLQTTPILKRRRSIFRRALDWCKGRDPRPEPNHRRLARRNVKKQYRR